MTKYIGKDYFPEKLYPIMEAIDASNMVALDKLVNNSNLNVKGKGMRSGKPLKNTCRIR